MQHYTLEVAAQKLGISVDELREMAKKKQIRAFQNAGTWVFQARDIDEKARQMGAGSDHELQLGEGSPAPKGTAKATAPRKPADDELALGGPKSSKRLPKPGSDSDVRLVIDDSPELKIDSDVRLDSPRPKKSGDSAVRLVPKGKGSDSDVKLVGDDKPASDSDIRLHDLPEPPRKKGKGADAGIITEEIDLDAEEAKQKAKPKGGKPALPTSSPYELSESDMGLPPPKGKKGTHDSSSEHEMVAFDPSKARGGDLGSGEIPLLSDDDVDLGGLPMPNAGNSGINLDEPADSGISLESGGSDELEFELSLDAGSTPKPAAKAKPDADSSSEFELSLDDAPSDTSDSEFELSLDEDGSPSSSVDIGLDKIDNSDSEFELTLDDDGGLAVGGDAKDIFEETNFDVPALDDSGSEAVALEDSDTDLESSEFDLSTDSSGDSSGSQVVATDDDADEGAATVAKPRKTAAKTAKAKAKPSKLDADDAGDLDLDFGDDSDEKPAAKKKTKTKKVQLDDDEDDLDEDDRPAPAPAAANWGPLPAVMLFPTMIVLFLAGLMGYELLQGAWGYHRSTKVSRPIIDNIARIFDDTIPKE
ncbi:MAG: hypothetical protein K2W96_00475 [Gemmataceae bacterium]|nr:hypothetical protein [Gemmataceae bacterium]